jgi:hypothetical protein
MIKILYKYVELLGIPYCIDALTKNLKEKWPVL